MIESDLSHPSISVELGELAHIAVDGNLWPYQKGRLVCTAWSAAELAEAQRLFDAKHNRECVQALQDRFCVEHGPGELVPISSLANVPTFSWYSLSALTPDQWQGIAARMRRPEVKCPQFLLRKLDERLAAITS
jgi:hypothetical protein